MKVYELTGVVRGVDIKSKVYTSRKAAEKKMCKLLYRHDLQVDVILGENTHYVTYRCNNDRTWFHIDRIIK